MSLKQALEVLKDPDGVIIAVDPHYVPPRLIERIDFIYVATMSALMPIALISVPATAVNLALIAAFALTVVAACYHGVKARRYRLKRLDAVARLRAAEPESTDRSQ